MAVDTFTEIIKLADLGFLYPKFFTENHWGALIPMGSFFCIVDGDKAALAVGYQNKWNFRDYHAAHDAFHAWDGRGEPKGYVGRQINKAYTHYP